MLQPAAKRREPTIRRSVAPPAIERRNPEVSQSGIRELEPKTPSYRPPAPSRPPSIAPRARTSLAAIPKKAPAARISVPPPKPTSKPPARLGSTMPPPPPRRSTPPPLPKAVAKPSHAADPTMELDVVTEVTVSLPPPPSVPAEAVAVPEPEPEVSVTAGTWPEPESDDDPYLSQLRRSSRILPPRLSMVMSDLRWAISPIGRKSARAELRKMTSCYLTTAVAVLRAFADGVEERIPS